MRIRVNHLGYERRGPKRALVEGAPEGARVAIAPASDAGVHRRWRLPEASATPGWSVRAASEVRFDDWQEPGEWSLVLEDSQGRVLSRSAVFSVTDGLLRRRTVSDVVFGLKSQRCSGRFERADADVPVVGSEDRRVDARGGWYDASGDVSKYLSHLSYANYFNPQQTPLAVWTLLLSAERLDGRGEPAARLGERMREEACHGADFLVRMRAPEGPFYMTLFDRWSKDVGERALCAYAGPDGRKTDAWQAGFRQGGGMAVAALAAASRLAGGGAFAADDYLHAARCAYDDLLAHNRAYLDDGEENLLDEYCALIAADELYRTTENAWYAEQATAWAERVLGRAVAGEAFFWQADRSGRRPFFHACDAGMPAIALLRAADASASDQAARLRSVALAAVDDELARTAEVANPYRYPRQAVKAVNATVETRFFIPHDNETGYWWQGENARLASLAAMALLAGERTDGEQALAYRQYAGACLDWVLGLNPFDVCMLHGHGRHNVAYLDAFPNYPGGICNGVTAGVVDEDDIVFAPEPYGSDAAWNWRWTEQWLPHAAWYLLAAVLAEVA
ncbi:glycoside hydrolase family 9 protein [Arhodomonas sp. AD133]|uniref:glycoside hydrolase family 9 protein n=1 Tax=Arhodomonas sp. AD133 TaxID=3415009 RepID=UPI003EBD639A